MNISIIALLLCVLVVFIGFFIAKHMSRISIEEVLPEMIEESAKGVIGPIDYPALTMSLVKALVGFYFLVSVVCIVSVVAFLLAHVAGLEMNF